MPCSRVYVALSLGVLLSGCMLHDTPLEPALPAPSRAYASYAQIDEAKGFPTADQLPVPPPLAPKVETLPPAPPPPPPGLLPSVPDKPRRGGKGTRRGSESLAEVLLPPGETDVFGMPIAQRYLDHTGKVYLRVSPLIKIVSSPQAATTVILPAGERLAQGGFSLNACPQQPTEGDPQRDDCWVVAVTVMGEGPSRREVILLRPLKAGLTGTMPIITTSGRPVYCDLKSQENKGMLSITWDVPQLLLDPETAPVAQRPSASSLPTLTRAALKPPQVNLDRLFTDYKIEVTSKQRPPWVPVQVFDDGSRTYIRFKEDLSFTASPAVFGLHADRSPAIIEFTPYQSPEGGLTYVVNNLHPVIQLRGTDSMTVTITRGRIDAR